MRNRFNGSNVSLALADAAASAVVTASLTTTAGQFSARPAPGRPTSCAPVSPAAR